MCVCSTVRIRATINVTSLTYSPQLDDQSSRDFAVLARGLKEAIESEYFTVPGQQTVDVLQFRYISLQLSSPWFYPRRRLWGDFSLKITNSFHEKLGVA